MKVLVALVVLPPPAGVALYEQVGVVLYCNIDCQRNVVIYSNPEV